MSPEAHKELTSERQEKKDEIDEQIDHLDKLIMNCDPLTKPAFIDARQVFIQAREKIKSDRKMETDIQLENGHNSDLNSLRNRSGKTAQTFFRDFVKRIEVDHAVKPAAELN